MFDSALMSRIRTSFTDPAAVSSTPTDQPDEETLVVPAGAPEPLVSPEPALAPEPAPEPETIAALTFPAEPSTQAQLAVLEQVLDEVETETAATALETAAEPATQTPATPTPATSTPAVPASTLNPQTVSATSFKEAVVTSSTESPAIEAGGGLQQVEYEPQPEIPVEVENYLQQVEQNSDQTPQEIIVADGQTDIAFNHKTVKKPVVVLPITEEIEKIGLKKSPHWSIRWLVEWSHKLMKMFSGSVVYQDFQGESSS